jgi:hypothetical protein
VAMRRVGAWTVCGFLWVSAAAQGPRPDVELIASRQAEVAEVGLLIYGIRVDAKTWTHRDINVCPALTHHVFARYDRMTGQGSNAAFVAIYDRDAMPTASQLKAKPWESGIVLVPLFGIHAGENGPAVERAETMTAFNAVWTNELRRTGHRDAFPGLSWSGLAQCYLRLAGEQPVVDLEGGSDGAEPDSIDLKGQLVSGVTVPLAGPGSRSAWVHFNPHGMVVEAGVSAAPKVKEVK